MDVEFYFGWPQTFFDHCGLNLPHSLNALLLKGSKPKVNFIQMKSLRCEIFTITTISDGTKESAKFSIVALEDEPFNLRKK